MTNVNATRRLQFDSDRVLFVSDVIFVGLTSVIFVLGAFFTSLSVITIVRTKSLHAATNVIICLLLCVDFLVAVIVLPVFMINRPQYRWAFGETFCQTFAVIDSSLCISKTFCITAIALDRCTAVRKPLQYMLVVNKISTTSISFIIVALSVVISAIPLIGWGAYEYTPEIGICSLSWGNNTGYLAFRIIVTVVIPTGIFIVLIVIIYRSGITRHRLFSVLPVRTAVFPIPIPSINQARTYRNTTMKAVRSLLTLAGLNAVLWLPYVILKFAQLRGYNRDITVELTLFNIFTFFTVSINPLLVIAFNRTLKETLFELLCRTPGTSQATPFSYSVHTDRLNVMSGESSRRNSASQSGGAETNNDKHGFEIFQNMPQSSKSVEKNTTRLDQTLLTGGKSSVMITLRPPTPVHYSTRSFKCSDHPADSLPPVE